MTEIENNRFKEHLINRLSYLLNKSLKEEFLNENRKEINRIIKIISNSKLLSEIILSYSDERLLLIFKFFAEKRKCIYEILINFNKEHKLNFNTERMNLYIEYIIFFAKITCNQDVYNFYGKLLNNIKKFPILYPDFFLY
jgi:hypothetical protein